MMPNPFDRLQRANLSLADERDKLRDTISELDLEATVMRARNRRLEKEVEECLEVIRDLINPNLGGIGHIAPWAITKAREIVSRLGDGK